MARVTPPTPWRELADLPYASALTPHRGTLAAAAVYDCEHFDQLSLDGADGGSARFLECALTGVTGERTGLRRVTFTDVWLRDTRLVAADLAESSWSGTTLMESALAGAEMYGATLRQVVAESCKLESVNLRGADAADVVFRNCLLRDVDFSGAALRRISFPGSRLSRVTFTGVRMDRVDLREVAELGITVDPTALRGAIMTSAQLIQAAPLLADSIGIILDDT